MNFSVSVSVDVWYNMCFKHVKMVISALYNNVTKSLVIYHLKMH